MAQTVSQEFVDSFFADVFGFTKSAAGKAAWWQIVPSMLFRYGMGGGTLAKMVPKKLMPGLRRDLMRWNAPAMRAERKMIGIMNPSDKFKSGFNSVMGYAPSLALGGAAYGLHAYAPDSVAGQVAKWVGPWAGTPVTAALNYGARALNHTAEEASKRTTDEMISRSTRAVMDKVRGITDYIPIWGDDVYDWAGKKVNGIADKAQEKAQQERDNEFRSFERVKTPGHGLLNLFTGSAFE